MNWHILASLLEEQQMFSGGFESASSSKDIYSNVLFPTLMHSVSQMNDSAA